VSGVDERAAERAAREAPGRCGRYLVNGRQLAGIFGVTPRTVQNWRGQRGLPAVARDRYDLAEIIPWYVNWQVAERLPAGGDEARLLKAQADEREEKALLVELRRRERAGELVLTVTVEREWTERVLAVKEALLALPVKIGRQMVGMTEATEAERIVRGEIVECLTHFAAGEQQAAAGRMFAQVLAAALAQRLAKGQRAAALRRRIAEILGDDPWSAAEEIAGCH